VSDRYRSRDTTIGTLLAAPLLRSGGPLRFSAEM
jgi:hypothetical protein